MKMRQYNSGARPPSLDGIPEVIGDPMIQLSTFSYDYSKLQTVVFECATRSINDLECMRLN